MLVTAFLLDRNKTVKKSIEHYVSMFDHLAKTGIPIILFLDASLKGTVNYRNVKVVYLSLEDLAYYKFLQKQNVPPIFNAPRESELMDYFIIINSKTEFIMRAMDVCPDTRFSWIDFGVSHIMENPKIALSNLWKDKYLQKGVVIAGGHSEPVRYQRELIWRFFGGFFSGTREDIKYFHDYQTQAYEKIYPIMDLEVKLWSYAETELGFNPKWYRSSFGDGFLDFDSLLDYSGAF